ARVVSRPPTRADPTRTHENTRRGRRAPSAAVASHEQSRGPPVQSRSSHTFALLSPPPTPRADEPWSESCHSLLPLSRAVHATRLAEITRDGIGHYTRVYGTRPVDPAERAGWLWEEQRRLKRETRLGIPALVHEESLTGLAAWKAAAFPSPLAWGATFDPALI